MWAGARNYDGLRWAVVGVARRRFGHAWGMGHKPTWAAWNKMNPGPELRSEKNGMELELQPRR